MMIKISKNSCDNDLVVECSSQPEVEASFERIVFQYAKTKMIRAYKSANPTLQWPRIILVGEDLDKIPSLTKEITELLKEALPAEEVKDIGISQQPR